MGRTIVRLFVGLVAALALLGGASLAGPLSQPAEAATTYVSATYTNPKRGQTNAGVKALQRRLHKVGLMSSGNITGYFGPITQGAVKKFQSRYHLSATGVVNRTTWNLLVKKSGKIKITTVKASKISARCKIHGRVLCVDKSLRKVYYMKNSKIIKTMDARFGCASSRTREGTFRVNWKSRHHVSSIYHTAMPYAMFFSGGQAVHYSADFAARGYNGCSHGCVNIRARSTIAWVFDQMRVGDRVVVYWS